MALQKSYGSKIVNGIEVEPQRIVDMHPLEEAAILAHWDLHPIESQIPHELFHHEELELMLMEGADAVKAKRKVRQDTIDRLKPQIDELKRKHDDAHKAWCDHADLCIAHGYDPDSFAGDARAMLKMPIKEENKDG